MSNDLARWRWGRWSLPSRGRGAGSGVLDGSRPANAGSGGGSLTLSIQHWHAGGGTRALQALFESAPDAKLKSSGRRARRHATHAATNRERLQRMSLCSARHYPEPPATGDAKNDAPPGRTSRAHDETF